MIISRALEVVANDVGAIGTTSHLAATKTIIATDVQGRIVIEASGDAVNFSDVATITGPASEAVINVAASHMRVRADGTASSVNVVAEQGRIRSVALHSSVNAPGTAVDISSFGSSLTFFAKVGAVGPIDVQISADNINWAKFKKFSASGWSTEDISTRFIRAVAHGATAGIVVVSDTPATRALNSPARAFVFRPGGTTGENVYADWADLVAAMSSVEGRKMLEFDDSMVSASGKACEIGKGVWEMKDVAWTGYAPRSIQGAYRAVVEIKEGAEFKNLRMIGGQITVKNLATTTAPISDFHGDNHVHIGLRDDGGNSQFQNLGTVPLFSLGANPVKFFIQNCLFGIGSTGPMIDHTGGVLQLTLLGQNRMGENLVKSAPGASVSFQLLSNAASIGAKQTSITGAGGKYSFGPLGRIQRQIVPMPPSVATASQSIDTPNALIRCDGTVGFTQVLMKVVGGFTNMGLAMYSGGQELVVAEVVGGTHLKVAPAAGDTIDGNVDPVPIAAHGSRTFVSDGVSNWITTSVVR